ncbi:uncharacterized protein LOC143423261 [Xylocopa sonorina]|uniref:uncharacterized protein LOC143423261 n=1 Tax=Xylocopa sonorina TaxID=1818115 RepID=UPI00403AFDB0
MEKKVINQKEYLKKYLASGHGDEKRKKKKKKMKLGTRTVKIIDDDIDLKNMRPMEQNEFDIFIDAEDAPQIAGVVDERGPVDFTDRRRWKIIADDEGGDLTVTSVDRETNQYKHVKNVSERDLSPPKKQKKYSDDDLSPPRTHKKQKSETSRASRRDEDSDLSPSRLKSKRHKVARNNSDNNESYEIDNAHHKIKTKTKRKQKVSDDSDLSPPRRSRKESNPDGNSGRNKEDSDSDLSPPRNRKNKNYDSDLSPPRKSKKHKHRTRNSDSDLSPPRKKHETNVNVHMSSKDRYRNNESDLSPPRQGKAHKDSYKGNKVSQSRQHKYRDEKTERDKNHKHFENSFKSDRRHYDLDISPPSKKNRNMDTSHSRFKDDSYKYKSSNKHNHQHKHRSHREDSYNKETKSKHRSTDEMDEGDNEQRMKKTLDGKTAGLQNAAALREETEAHKKREAEHFSKLSKDVTGVGQAAVVRDTKTGKKRNLEAEAAVEREKQKRQAELDEKYSKWGRGLKQVEDREEKLKDDLYEMSKPLARYADDADLDKRLREQEREGDPMLEYIKQKQVKEGKRQPDRPTYEGSYMPNRFGIRPGHRWDGVDRSNGYEKRWFEAQNAKVARQEEAYKWSTSDM